MYGLDVVLKGGFGRKELAVIAAETSGGKTILLLLHQRSLQSSARTIAHTLTEQEK
jgi:hypothetical protein